MPTVAENSSTATATAAAVAPPSHSQEYNKKLLLSYSLALISFTAGFRNTHHSLLFPGLALSAIDIVYCSTDPSLPHLPVLLILFSISHSTVYCGGSV